MMRRDRFRVLQGCYHATMNARNRHDHFVANRPQAFQPFSRKLLRDFKVMTVNSEEHHDQKRNQPASVSAESPNQGTREDGQYNNAVGKNQTITKVCKLSGKKTIPRQ